MTRPIKGKLVAEGGAVIEILGTLADAPLRRQVGHAVADDVLPIVKAVGAGEKISLEIDKEPLREVEMTILDLASMTLRFRVHG